MRDTRRIQDLLVEWLSFTPDTGRLDSIRRSIVKSEILVAVSHSRVVGFIHYVIHDDIIDGAPNALITAFYVTESSRSQGGAETSITRNFFLMGKLSRNASTDFRFQARNQIRMMLMWKWIIISRVVSDLHQYAPFCRPTSCRTSAV